jgi:hypothetical protein
VVTAYGAAKQGGYTGTYEEFCQGQAEFMTYAQASAASAQAAEESAQAAQATAASIPEYTALAGTVSYLETAVAQQRLTGTLDITWEQGTFNSSSWKNSSSSYYIRSDGDIPAAGISSLNYTITGSTTYRFYCLYKKMDGTTGSSYLAANSGSFALDTDVAYVRLILRVAANASTPLSPSTAPEVAVTYVGRTAADIQTAVETVSQKLEDVTAYMPLGLMASFKRFAVYSDSLSAGHIYPDESTTSGSIDDKSISWPVYLARQLGNTVYNHSRHGQSPDTFISGILRGASTGDNNLDCALDGDHNVPLCIISFGGNNTNSLETGTVEDIDADNCDNNADTVYGNSGKLVQRISDYYAGIGQPVHIAILLYGAYSTSTDPAKVHTRWTEIIDRLKDTVEAQGNYLWPIDIYADNRQAMANDFFAADVINGHWTSIGYNALGELVGQSVSRYMYKHPEQFMRIEFAESNRYIETYHDPENYT